MVSNWYRLLCNILKPWMKFHKGLSEKTSVQVGIDFSSGDAFVSQHFLYCPQISSSLYQMRGEGMSECMRGYVFLNLGLLSQVLDDIKYHDP